jgi:hypothetical protein
MEYEYKVVPFLGQVELQQAKKSASQEVAEQLAQLINSETKAGYEFNQLNTVNMVVSDNPGCFAGLFGARASEKLMQFDMLIFRRIITPAETTLPASNVAASTKEPQLASDSTCPSCGADLHHTASNCKKCFAAFDGPSSWKPIRK